MIRNYFLAGFATMLFIGAAAQTSTLQKEEVAKTPQANVTFKTIQKPNPLIEQVNILTKGDDVLTEKTILQIRTTKSSSIKRVVADNEYNLLSKEIQLEGIKESEVIIIINSIK